MKNKFNKYSNLLQQIMTNVGEVVVGQKDLIEKTVLALICDGHVLIEGVPGIAKTLTVNTLANTINSQFSRIQFTPDLLPADLIGTLIFQPADNTFVAEKGPVFTNILLADEINRAPAKVQSALLEAMQEKQVTLGKETHDLPFPFFVLATQNPVEQEGTYTLPEAQVDRFMFKLKVDYPTAAEELTVMRRMSKAKPKLDVKPIMKLDDILEIREILDDVYMDEKIETYIIDLVQATRNPDAYGLELAEFIRFGASPRATIALAKAAKAAALFSQRDYVTPDDIKYIIFDTLRHRIALSYRAEAAGLNSDEILTKIIAKVEIKNS